MFLEKGPMHVHVCVCVCVCVFVCMSMHMCRHLCIHGIAFQIAFVVLVFTVFYLQKFRSKYIFLVSSQRKLLKYITKPRTGQEIIKVL